jgi:hypothetical protein
MARKPRSRRERATPSEIANYKADIERLAKQSRYAIQIIAAILATAFAFVVLGAEQVAGTLNRTDPTIIYKIGLFAYYTCWVFGAKFDVDIEERVYVRDNLHGILDWKAIGILAIFTVAMLLFFWLHYYERIFAVGLLAFIAANYAGWRTVCRRIDGPIQDSISYYEKLGDHFGSTKVRVVDGYMRGTWQRQRFAVMAAMGVALLMAANAEPLFGIAPAVRGMTVLNLDADKLVYLAPAMLFLIYVTVAEAWMWIQRAKVHVCVTTIEGLSKKYVLEPLK